MRFCLVNQSKLVACATPDGGCVYGVYCAAKTYMNKEALATDDSFLENTLDVEKPICHLSLLPILLNCVRSHVDLYCVRSVRVSSSSDR